MANLRDTATVPPFRERALWFGADLQTVRNLLRGGPPDLSGGERLLIAMPDGDRLAARLDVPPRRSARPLVVLIHGLTGSERSLAVVATMRHLLHQGWPVLRLNLRGTLLSRATSTGRYHAGKTEDLAAALSQLPAELRGDGVVLLGHSLGYRDVSLKIQTQKLKAFALVEKPFHDQDLLDIVEGALRQYADWHPIISPGDLPPIYP